MISERPQTAAQAAEQSTAPAYDARLLTKEGDLARILLDGQIYTLRITRASKLILTK